MGYSPTLGRWLLEDPIDYEGGDPNLYGFVGNNPVNRLDPSGLSAIGAVIGGAGQAGLAAFSGPQFRYDSGDGDLPSIAGTSPFRPEPYSLFGFKYGVEARGVQPVTGSVTIKSTGATGSRISFKNQSVNLSPIGGCDAQLKYDATISVAFARMFKESPTGSGKFPFGAGGGFIPIAIISKQYKNVTLTLAGVTTELGDFWERVGVIIPREAMYISGGEGSVQGPTFGHTAQDLTKLVRQYVIDDTTDNMEAELSRFYQHLANIR